MNVTIEGVFLNGYEKSDYTHKSTGEVIQGDYVVQIQQQKKLSNGQVQIESFDVPVDRSMASMYNDFKLGDEVSIPCNVYGENFAQIKIGKAK